MTLPVLIVTIYGAFNLIGGFIGYVKVKSKASLIAGGVAGVVLLAAAHFMHRGSEMAPIISLIVALLLGGRFLGTFFKTKRIMPDLVMILLSAATFVIVGMSILG